MRELFESPAAENPMQAARRGARPVLRRRFYENATVAATPDGHAVQLDGKPVLTPARRPLAAPTRELAQALAAEWNAQTEVVDPAMMPLTRLANSIIDGVAQTPRPVADEIKKYLASDLLFYRAGEPEGLVERQARHWDPILQWVAETLGAKFYLGEGVVHVAQPEIRAGSSTCCGTRRSVAARRGSCHYHAYRLGPDRGRHGARGAFN